MTVIEYALLCGVVLNSVSIVFLSSSVVRLSRP
jgi:hypothetical protein